MMFAEAASPDSNHLLQFFLILSLLGNVITPIIVLIINFRKQKREITYAFDPASKDEFDKHVEDTKEQFRRLDEQRSEDLRASALSRKAIYDKLDATKSELTEKIESVPNQVIATLRNFGVIGGKH